MCVVHAVVGPATDLLAIFVPMLTHHRLLGRQAIGCDCLGSSMVLECLLHEHFIEVPAPFPEATYAINLLPLDVRCEHRAKLVPPGTHRLMADVDASLERQILNVPQAQRKSHIHHHYRPNYLR